MSTNPHPMSGRWIRKSVHTGDGAAPRSRNRRRDISNGSRNEPVSGIRAMNGCGNVLQLPTVLTMIYEAQYVLSGRSEPLAELFYAS